ncbi:MAG: uncharacterized protein KVP18_003919 [Porospora cf. gigantea A]|uniref:uncharacterized protein n=1 Tax=Porospora cf. gigantea A TaxID=2853593 RepID=UPI003559E8FF|nr:MAG: hypothetical protein KVP18_003919 [Porospora cf. gigantea A]
MCEYSVYTASWPFYVENSDIKGKRAMAKHALESGAAILVNEFPMACWPLSISSAGSGPVVNGDTAHFCEECLKLAPILDRLSPFCSDACLNSATGAGSGWFPLLGGSAGLTRLRKAACSHQILTLEALGRVTARVLALAISLAKAGKGDWKTVQAAAGSPVDRLCFRTDLELVDVAAMRNVLQDVMEPQMSKLMPELQLDEWLPTVDELRTFLSKLALNGQTLHIWGSDANDNLALMKAAGVYTLQSTFNHDCRPNTRVEMATDCMITLITERDVSAGEELTITYISDGDRASRHQALALYAFQCTCARCGEDSV